MSDPTPEEMVQRRVRDLDARTPQVLQRIAYQRQAADEAEAHGERSIAKTLRLLASIEERDLAALDAERERHVLTLARLARRRHLHAISTRPRQSRRPALLDLIDDAMRPMKTEGVQFNTMIQRWKREALDGLRLQVLPCSRYEIIDENGDAGSITYKRSTLQKLYSLAGGKSRTASVRFR